MRREVAPSWCSPSRAAARAHLPWEAQAHPACMAWGAPVLRSPARTRAAPSGRPEAPRRGPTRPSGADPGIFAAWPALTSPAQPDALAAHLGCHGPLRLGLSFRAPVSRARAAVKFRPRPARLIGFSNLQWDARARQLQPHAWANLNRQHAVCGTHGQALITLRAVWASSRPKYCCVGQPISSK